MKLVVEKNEKPGINKLAVVYEIKTSVLLFITGIEDAVQYCRQDKNLSFIEVEALKNSILKELSVFNEKQNLSLYMQK